MNGKQSGGANLTPDEKGVYRWHYELNLLKDYSIFFLIWRIFFIILTAGFLIVIFAVVGRFGVSNHSRFLENLTFYGYFLLGMTAVTLIGYLIYAAVMRGKYCVDFEMDKKGILHKQTEEQANKAKTLSKLTAAAGAASGRLSAAGAGLAAARTEMYSDFSKVKKVKAYPARGLIKVNGVFNRNRIYVDKARFSFVLSYIQDHCPEMKK